MATKICIICQKEFQSFGRVRTCSPECTHKRKKEYMRNYMKTWMAREGNKAKFYTYMKKSQQKNKDKANKEKEYNIELPSIAQEPVAQEKKE